MTKISFLIIVFAVVFLSGCIGETDIIRGNEGVFDIEINNTNLAPSVAGETVGTGERVQGVTYYANDTPIEIFVWGHGQNVSQTAEIHLYINGTKVADTSGRPLGASEQSNKTIVAIIPRYASYKIEANNAHHYEWREYKVIAGTNGSVSLTNNYYNTTGGGGGVSFNGTPVDLNGSNLYNGTFDINSNLSLKVNKSGNETITGPLNITGTLDMGYNNITNSSAFVLYQTNSYNAVNFTVNRSYTGLANPITEFDQSSSVIKFRVTGNDLTGGYNFRVNARANQSQDDPNMSGWSFFIKPSSPNCAGGFSTGTSELGIWRAKPGTSSIDTVFNICENKSVQVGSTANFTMLGVGKGIQIREGTNAKQGTCTMAAGACTVSNTQITSNSRLFYNYQNCSANIGILYESARTPGTSFIITNTNGANTCTVAYEIFEPS